MNYFETLSAFEERPKAIEEKIEYSSLETGNVFKRAGSSEAYIYTDESDDEGDRNSVEIRSGVLYAFVRGTKVTLLSNAVFIENGEDN